MKTPRKDHCKRLTSTQQVDLYFECILERQRLEEEYYRKGNVALSEEIGRAREKIRDVMREIGIKF